MRSVTSLAVLATSLLVKEVFAGRYDVRKRDYWVETDEVIVTAEIIVTDMGNGVYATGGPVMIGTATIDGSPVLVVETISSSTSTTPTPAPATSSSAEAAVFIETSSTTTPKAIVTPTPAPTPSTTSIAPVPTTSTTPLVVAAAAVPATTLIQVPASKTTTAAAVAAAPAKSSPSSIKRGVAYNDPTLTNPFAAAGLVSWAYNWGSDSGGTISSTLEYVPMLWGLRADDVSNWSKKASAALAAGSTHILSFNEPDFSGEANLGTAVAAAGWKTHMEPFAGKAKLGSPAVTNGGEPMGLTWLSGFLSACSSCTIDFVTIHWYNGGSAKDFQTYVTKAYAAGGNRPLWITEFQASGSTTEQQAFLTTVLPWLDASPMVERYAYFMAADGNLINGKGLSPLGKTYATT